MTAAHSIRVRPVPRADGVPLRISVVYVNAALRRVVRRYQIPADLISRPSQAQAGWALDTFLAELNAGWRRIFRANSEGWGADGWWHASLEPAPFAVGETVRAIRPGKGLVYYRALVTAVSSSSQFTAGWLVTIAYTSGNDEPGAEPEGQFAGTPDELHRWLYAQ